MALPPPKAFRQDLPPKGGFVRPEGFPAEGYRKRSPGRGPPGWVLIAGAVAVTAIGWYRLLDDIHERNYYNLSRFNEKFERAYVLQAREDAAWLRRQKEFLDAERKLMANNPGWVVGQRRFFTQFEDKPDKEVLDQRKIGAW